MMKPKSAPTAKDLRHAATVDEVLALLRYGIHAKNKPAFVRIVEDGETVEIYRVTGEPERPGAQAAIGFHEAHNKKTGHRKQWRDVDERVLGHHCANAILAGDAEFFHQMADAVAMLKTGRMVEAGKRAAFVLLILEAIQRNQPLPSVLEVQAKLKARFRAKVDAAEIRRWRRTIGVPLPEKRRKADTKRTGWHRGEVQKELNRLGRHIEDGDKQAALLIKAAYPELADKARRFILQERGQ